VSLADELWPGWMADALCAEPEYRDVPFFPERGQSAKKAREVCERCLVADECRAYAEANHITFGVWGGDSMDFAARRRRRQVA